MPGPSLKSDMSKTVTCHVFQTQHKVYINVELKKDSGPIEGFVCHLILTG